MLCRVCPDRVNVWGTSGRTWPTMLLLFSLTPSPNSEVTMKKLHFWVQLWKKYRGWRRYVYHACVGGVKTESWFEDRENLLGNNVWKLPDEIFLGLYRAAPWRPMKRRTLQRYVCVPCFCLLPVYSSRFSLQKVNSIFLWVFKLFTSCVF